MSSSDLSWAAPVFWASTEQGEPVADPFPVVVQSPNLDDNTAVDDLDGKTVDHQIKKPYEPADSKHDAFVNQRRQLLSRNLRDGSEYRDDANSLHGHPLAETVSEAQPTPLPDSGIDIEHSNSV